MTIPQPVINTFMRIGLNPKFAQEMADRTDKVKVENRFGGGSCETNPLVAYLINWVYETSNDYERTPNPWVKLPTIADFDRVRYFIAKVDGNAYMTCID